MIKIDYDSGKNAVIIEVAGDVDAAQGERALQELEKLLPSIERGFKLLADFSAVETMEPDVEGVVIRGMDLVNANGVSEVIRVLPDPDLDLGFNMLSIFHYSRQVQFHNVRTREEAEPLLRERIKG
jgi:hypothetical protein